MKTYVFARPSKKVAEMRNEIGRLQGSVERLEAICKHGSLVKPYVPRDSDIAGLRQATGSLHGWTVSLVESDFYLLSALDNRIHAYAKWAKAAKSLEYLQLERQVSMQDISGKKISRRWKDAPPRYHSNLDRMNLEPCYAADDTV